MFDLITPLIICGGSGTRLWPVSRADLPKQFLPLFGARSTFQETVRRVCDADLFAPPVIISHQDYSALLVRQLDGIAATVLLEPGRRGSGPAILAGTAWIEASRGPDALVLALAADHVIRDVAGFRAACRAGLTAAQAGSIVTFGLVPDHPATTYGYIEPGEMLAPPARVVRRFIEKPDAATALRCVAEGYLWNSGNFLFQALSLRQEYERWDGATAAAVVDAVAGAHGEADAVRLDERSYNRANARSIDHVVMEKTQRAAVIPVVHDWLDIGSWQAVHRLASNKTADEAPSEIRSLTIKPGETFERHHSPSECWIVAAGSGVVTVAGEARLLRANDFIDIADKAKCRIENRAENNLQIVIVPGAFLQP